MKEYNNRLEILRAYSIFSVVCAHTAVAQESSPSSSLLTIRIMTYIATLGVPVFLFLAGYFFSLSKDNILVFLKKKLISVVIPWLFCFTMLWLYVVLRKGGITFFNWLLFVIGKGSSAYFISMLLSMYVLFFVGRKSRIVACIGIAISIVFYFLKSISFVGRVDDLISSPYLNVFYWMCYFCLGILVATTGFMDKLIECSKKLLPVTLGSTIVFIVYFCLRESPPNYFERWSWMTASISGLAMMGLSSIDAYKRVGFIEKVGNFSFSIYLCHQFFSGLIIHLTELADCWITVIVRPAINILIVMFLIAIYKKINVVSKDKLSFAGYLIGLKRNRKP